MLLASVGFGLAGFLVSRLLRRGPVLAAVVSMVMATIFLLATIVNYAAQKRIRGLSDE